MNPYESPPLLADEARYDRTLFWRITKAVLILGGIFITIDAGCCMWFLTTHRFDITDYVRFLFDF